MEEIQQKDLWARQESEWRPNSPSSFRK